MDREAGWTGQPLMQKWPKEIRSHMNMYDWAKEKENLVEVIYACMDGYVYFLDLETGKKPETPCILAIPSKVPERWIPEAIRSSMWEQDITAMRELPGSLW